MLQHILNDFPTNLGVLLNSKKNVKKWKFHKNVKGSCKVWLMSCWRSFCCWQKGSAPVLPLEWALLFKTVQTTWKDSPSPGTWSQLSIMPSSGLLRHWHAALRWRAGGHSVSWQELAAQAPWRHVSHHHWKSADRQTAGMLRWRSGGGEEGEGGEGEGGRERQHLVLADFTVCPPRLSRQ